MRIEAKIERNFIVNVKFFDAPKCEKVALEYYGIIQAMKKHDNKAFNFAIDRFLTEELRRMEGKEDD